MNAFILQKPSAKQEKIVHTIMTMMIALFSREIEYIFLLLHLPFTSDTSGSVKLVYKYELKWCWQKDRQCGGSAKVLAMWRTYFSLKSLTQVDTHHQMHTYMTYENLLS